MTINNIDIISNIKNERIEYHHKIKKYIYKGLYYFDSISDIYSLQKKNNSRIKKNREGLD